MRGRRAVAGRKVLVGLVEGIDAFVQVVNPNNRWMAINRAAADEFERIYGAHQSRGQHA